MCSSSEVYSSLVKKPRPTLVARWCITKSIQQYEVDISKSEYAARKKAEEEKDVIQEKELIKKYPKTLAEMPQEDLENTSEPTEND